MLAIFIPSMELSSILTLSGLATIISALADKAFLFSTSNFTLPEYLVAEIRLELCFLSVELHAIIKLVSRNNFIVLIGRLV